MYEPDEETEETASELPLIIPELALELVVPTPRKNETTTRKNRNQQRSS